MAPPMIYLLRHGQTPANDPETEILRGQDYDGSLSFDGTLQATNQGNFLTKRGVTRIYTSSVRRVMETAQIVGQKLGIGILVEPLLMDWDIGDWSGVPVKGMEQTLQLYQDEKQDVPPPNGEPAAMFYARVTEGLEKLRMEALHGATIVAVTHNSWVRALPVALGEARAAMPKSPIKPGGIVMLDPANIKQWKVVL